MARRGSGRERHPPPAVPIFRCPLVFQKDERPVGDWRKTWKRACTAARLPGKLFHDLRRTVVRNLIRAGVPERVAMSVTGHKTRSVFDRYNIVSEADLKHATDRLAEPHGENTDS